jgi:AhpD family alkylhydroperoxidase
MTEKNFPEIYSHISDLMGEYGKQAPNTMGGFTQLHKATAAGGALSAKIKELIALSISIAICCEGCIAFHVHDALKAGATKAEIVDAIGVAIMLGGGPAMVYGVQTLNAVEQFENKK